MDETTLVNILTRGIIMLWLLRVWMQLARVDYYNPVTLTFVKTLRPIVDTVSLVLRPIGRINSAALVISYGIAYGYVWWAIPNMPPIALAVLALAIVVSSALSIVFWVLLAMVICSWVVSPDNAWVQLIQQLMRPILVPIQRILPNFGGIDFSPIIVFLSIQLIRGVVESRLFALSTSLAM